MAIPDLKPPMTAEAIEDSVRNAKRIIKQRVNELEDLRDSTALKVRKAPFASVGIALGAGLLIGVALGWIGKAGANCAEKTAA